MPMATVDGRVEGYMVVVRGLHRATSCIMVSRLGNGQLELWLWRVWGEPINCTYWSKPVGPCFGAIRITSLVWILGPFPVGGHHLP